MCRSGMAGASSDDPLSDLHEPTLTALHVDQQLLTACWTPVHV